MLLSDIQLKTDYNKVSDDIAEDFYLPCMRASCRYDRISGYFASTIFIIAWEALRQFVDNGGHMRLICSPFVSDEDRIALESGYSRKCQGEIIAQSIQKEIEDLFSSPSLTAPSTVLAYLVAQDIIEVKIAIPIGDNTPVDRLFHDKVGVFYDEQNNAVGFRGAMNETFKGLSSDGNIESIDVFPSWEDSRDQLRLAKAQAYFNDLWADSIHGIKMYEFPAAAKEILKRKSQSSDWRALTEEIAGVIVKARQWKADKAPGAKSPRPHQINALEAWMRNGRRGILEHATGSGKTYTAICAIRNALERGEVVLLCVPSRELLGQWAKELKENLGAFKFVWLLCGDGYDDWKRPGTLARWTLPNTKKHRVIITTLSTCVMPGFIEGLTSGSHVLCIADEVHRTGALSCRKLFTFDAGSRLGLSATPYRYGDPEGTAALLDYFGGIINPPFTLKDAINANVLTRYFYYPQVISLYEEEQTAWDEISVKISKAIAIANRTGVSDESNMLNSPGLKRLLIARARIVKEAKAKIDLALSVLRKVYRQGQRWLVYCDNQQQLSKVLELLLENDFDAYEYHSGMSGDRESTLRYFTRNGGVLVSIKCLDEGVDIPAATHALILASSKNPREFIQRRGRILRKSPGKACAYLYDAVVKPFKKREDEVIGTSIVEMELSRAIEFGKWAENPTCISTLQNLAVDFGIDPATLIKEGVENE